jgi:hypothetical protein
MKTALTVLVFLCMITCAACLPAFSQTASMPGNQERDLCWADQQKFCAGLAPGPQMGECLDKNSERLSQECRDAHQQIKRRMAKGLMPGHPLAGCRQDIQKLCAGVDDGMGPVMECLIQNESRLSDNCRTKLRDIPPPPGHS